MARPGRNLFSWLVALGPVRGTAAVTAFTIAASLLISIAVTAALNRLSLMGVLISIAIPALLVPVSWYPFFQVSVRLSRAEARLRASEEKYRSILETMSDAYIEIDRAGAIVFFNDALCRISGYARHELAGRSVADLTVPGTLPRIRTSIARQLRRGRGGEFDGIGLLARDGTIRTLEASFSLRRGEAGARLIRAVLRDVTARETAERVRKEYEERLRRAEKMQSIGLLAGGVAHDLNNVLSGLVGYPDILLHEHPDDPSLRAGLSAIRESGERAAGIVQDLLTLSRHGVAATQPLDLGRLAADHCRSPQHERLLRDRPEVSFSLELQPEAWVVQGAPVQITKALANLLLNAFEAVPSAGAVRLATANRHLERPLLAYEEVPAGDYATVAVSDTGTGMTREDLERAFEPFYTRKVLGRSGTGLGMAVVWGVVKDHAGFVDIRSVPGAGTTVELFFPAKREEPPPPPDPAALDEVAPFLARGERVLVVDDLPDQRDLVARMLGRLGYATDEAAGGPEAVERLRTVGADLVVLDMIIGTGPDGLDTCRMLREIRPGLPVILVSGYSESERVLAALALGGVAYLKKPFRMGSLARLAREALERRGPA